MPTALPTRGANINSAPTESQLRVILNRDSVWAAYALGDLAPAYAPYSRWCVAGGTQDGGLILLFSRLSPPALFAMGEPDGVASAIDGTEMPDSIYLLIRQEHFGVVSRYYDLPATNRRNMWRMRLIAPDTAAIPSALPEGLQLRALEVADKDRMFRLYANGGTFAPDAFDVYQVEDGTFFGVTDNQGEIVASGGTHVVNWDAGVAAIGNMYTHPEHRGLGLGQAVLRAIVANLLRRGAANIVLNVDQRNVIARRLYERNGFEVYCPYLEGIAERK
jgi:ribosomal protein S18 acetylase RimI-like enzyme